MPSLKVSKHININTFAHFHENFIKSKSQRTTTAKWSAHLIINVSITALCSLVYLFWDTIIIYHWRNVYLSNKLYYSRDWMVFVAAEFVFTILFIFLFFNSYFRHSLKLIIAHSFCICVVLNGTIITILLWEAHENNNEIWYLKWFCSIMEHFDSPYSCKDMFSLLSLYLYIFSIPLCLLFSVLINVCAYYNYLCFNCTNTAATKNDKNNNCKENKHCYNK